MHHQSATRACDSEYTITTTGETRVSRLQTRDRTDTEYEHHPTCTTLYPVVSPGGLTPAPTPLAHHIPLTLACPRARCGAATHGLEAPPSCLPWISREVPSPRCAPSP